MNKEIIYNKINKVFTEYIDEGIDPNQFMNFLNTDKNNFEYMYNRIYKKLSIDNVQFDSDTLRECIVNIVRDNIYLLNDLKNI